MNTQNKKTNILNPLPIDENTMAKLMKFLFSRKKSIESLFCFICYHPSFVFSILYSANTPSYGFAGKITNLTTAIMVLSPSKVIEILSNSKIVLFNNKKLKKRYSDIIYISKKYTKPLYHKEKNIVYLNEDKEFENVSIHIIAGIHILLLVNYKEDYFNISRKEKLNFFYSTLTLFNYPEDIIKRLENNFNLFSKNNI